MRTRGSSLNEQTKCLGDRALDATVGHPPHTLSSSPGRRPPAALTLSYHLLLTTLVCCYASIREECRFSSRDRVARCGMKVQDLAECQPETVSEGKYASVASDIGAARDLVDWRVEGEDEGGTSCVTL